MFKYKFMNGYTAEVPNKAMNPGVVNTSEIIWSPEVPNFEGIGNQFMGEYLYSFIPRLVQPQVDRINQKVGYLVDLKGRQIMVEFTPNDRPHFEMMPIFASNNYGKHAEN